MSLKNWFDASTSLPGRRTGIARGYVLLALACALAGSANAQFAQQGNALTAADVVGINGPGYSVAISSNGNTAVIGGPGDLDNAGGAFVFTRVGSTWNQGAALINPGANDQQGYAVAISADGGTIIVGSPEGNSGEALVYTLSGGVWTQQGSLVAADAQGVDTLGSAVALSSDGSTAIVGGPNDNYGVGAAWVFTRTGSVWTQQGFKLVGSGAANGTLGAGIDYGALQGTSVAISSDGNTAIVGGPGDNAGIGATWVFTRTGGAWSQQGQKLIGTGSVVTATLARQGTSVAISADGNTAILGGPEDNDGAGAAWVFTQAGGAWNQQGPKLVGSGATVIKAGFGALQGTSVAISADGNTAIVGGPGDDGAGAAWVFTRSGSVWSQPQAKLVATGGSGGNQGFSVALSGDGYTAIVGAPQTGNSVAGIGVGAAYVFATPAAGQSGGQGGYTDFGSNNSFSTNGWCITGAGTTGCGPAGTRNVAAPFVASSNFSLGSISLPLSYFSGTNGALITLAANGPGGIPGSILESWSVTNLPSGTTPALTSVVSTNNPVLQAGETYWVEVQPLAADTLDIWYTNNQNLGGGLGWDFSQGVWIALSGYAGQTLPAFSVQEALASQTITFGGLPNVTLGVAPFTISATASSGLAVSFASSTPVVCTVSGSQVTVVAVGTCTIQATQAGNTKYAAATPVTQSFSGGVGFPIQSGPAATAVSPGAGIGASQTFTFTFSDPSGYQNLEVVNVLMNNYLDGIQACYVAYSKYYGMLLLVDDGGDSAGPYAGYLTVPSTGSMSNSQCTVNGAGSSVAGSGNTLTLTLNVSFTGPFAGNRIFYTAAGNAAGTENSGWQALGAWTVP